MAIDFSVRGGVADLRGRRSERAMLDRLIEAVRAGESRALVVRGEPGVGKTALLDYLAEHASGCFVARAAGVQSEMELAFAGVHGEAYESLPSDAAYHSSYAVPDSWETYDLISPSIDRLFAQWRSMLGG
jgi:hypothetical protein